MPNITTNHAITYTTTTTTSTTTTSTTTTNNNNNNNNNNKTIIIDKIYVDSSVCDTILRPSYQLYSHIAFKSFTLA